MSNQPSSPETDSRQRLLQAFEQQRRWCEASSPFTARVLAASADWLRSAPAAQAMAQMAAAAADPVLGAVPLRWAAGLHWLALAGLQPWAGLWPSTCTRDAALPEAVPAPAPDQAVLRAAIEQAWQSQGVALSAALQGPPQTNEVMRSAVLLLGLLQAQALHPHCELRLLELGSAAGLNLLADQWRHAHGAWRWGSADAPLTLQAQWSGEPAPSAWQTLALRIVSRQGCDPQPLQHQGQDALRLKSFVWADQAQRLSRLRAALAHAAAPQCPPFEVQQRGALAFLTEQLKGEATASAASQPAPTLRLILHSIVWQYIDPAEQQAVQALIEHHGAQATPERPLAWLRMEPPDPDARTELRLRCWPGGEDRLLARCHPHGSEIQGVSWQT